MRPNGSSQVLATLESNLDRILSDLMQLAGSSRMLMMLDYTIPGSDPCFNSLVDSADVRIAGAGSRHGAVLVDARLVISPRPCDLTFFCSVFDSHPTDLGYARLAEAFGKAAGPRRGNSVRTARCR